MILLMNPEIPYLTYLQLNAIPSCLCHKTLQDTWAPKAISFLINLKPYITLSLCLAKFEFFEVTSIGFMSSYTIYNIYTINH